MHLKRDALSVKRESPGFGGFEAEGRAITDIHVILHERIHLIWLINFLSFVLAWKLRRITD